MIIVSDDFPGIANAIEKFFPDTDHQLCFIHLQSVLMLLEISRKSKKAYLYYQSRKYR